MKTIKVSASRNYDILIASALLAKTGEEVRKAVPKAQCAAVITDSSVENLYLEPVIHSLAAASFKTAYYSIPPGESSKSGAQYIALLDWLCDKRLSRSDVIVALGGGVVGDLAGFAAATYLRGIPFVQIPTTLLAMVDSSVGGKTGIDLPAGKNLAGAFYQPSLVLCDTDTLQTLPEGVFKDGLAEVIKYGMIGSMEILFSLKKSRQDAETQSNQGIKKTSPDLGVFASLREDLGEMITIIENCISLKRDIVQRDEFDAGERMLLNFGHTVGHAIEQLSGYTVSHGFAVAAGMAVDTRAAFRKGLCPAACLETLENLLERLGLPNSTNYTAQEIYDAALRDKKRDGDFLSNAVPRAPGKCELRKIRAEDLLDWIAAGLAV